MPAISHLHIVRAGETKLSFSFTFEKESDASIAYERVQAWFKDGPRPFQVSCGAPGAVKIERVKT